MGHGNAIAKNGHFYYLLLGIKVFLSLNRNIDVCVFFLAALSNGAYERFCVLFNIGALLSQIASSQNHTSDDGLKTSAKYYQQSAGIFAYLKDNVNPVLQTLPTPDLAVSCLSTLSAIMVAQAQECIYTKASTGELSNIFINIIELSC